MEKQNIREATHAGSWYNEDKTALDQELSKYLQDAEMQIKDIQQIKALICPHAGYRHCGSTAAWSYKYLKPIKNLRVFLIGPSHHSYIDGCGLSSLDWYETPLGNIQIDQQTISELVKTKKFIQTDQVTEEGEHSLEMQLPYIQKMLGSQPFKLVPIMVGQLTHKQEQEMGQVLAKYLEDPNTLFVISSDFCHWGKKFSYRPYNEQDGQIWQSIEKLDKQGVVHIESQNPKAFTDYIDETKTTICGRKPIAIYLYTLFQSTLKDKIKTKLVRYSQSNKVQDLNDTSVSYSAMISYI